MTTPADIIGFWFDDAARAKWFVADAAFDAEIAARFSDAVEAARTGQLDDWRATPMGALALVLLLDQFTRNIYRDTSRAYECDDAALRVARQAITAGHDQKLPTQKRGFLYLPFMHSEQLAVQDEGLVLYEALGDAERSAFARRHRDAVARFGRLPARNAVLGRPPTEAEQAFMTQHPTGF